MFDFIIVGAGLSGSIIARELAERGKKILLLERRTHVAGNTYDYINETGILVQKYGPHIFHTNIPEVWTYIKKYGDWIEYHLECMVYMKGKYTPSPFNYKTIDDYYSIGEAEKIKAHIKFVYGNSPKVTIVEMLNSKDNVIKNYAQFLFDNDYSLYTAKQWGIKPSEIDVSVLRRVPVLLSYKTGYFDDKYQFMPKNGFSSVVKEILKHQNITIKTNSDALKNIKINKAESSVLYEGQQIPIVWTGALDELFGYKYGKLPYRSLRFEFKTIDKDSYQDAPVVAYPQEKGFTRITEYKKLPFQNIKGKTTIVYEYPLSVGSGQEPYYPIPTEQSQKQYQRYKNDAKRIKNLFLCGRLAEYKYYNMDQVVNRSLQVSKTI